MSCGVANKHKVNLYSGNSPGGVKNTVFKGVLLFLLPLAILKNRIPQEID